MVPARHPVRDLGLDQLAASLRGPPRPASGRSSAAPEPSGDRSSAPEPGRPVRGGLIDPLRRRSAGRLVLGVLAVAAAYYLAARVGLMLEIVGGQVTPLWPPTGVALVALIVLGLRAWPGITLGAFLLNVPLGPTLPAVALISAGNTLAPICGYLLLRRVGFRTRLDRPVDVLALVFLGALAGTAVSASIGTAALVLGGAVPPSAFLPTWSVWWTGDTMGVLVIAPLLLVAPGVSGWLRGMGPHRRVEAVALLAGTAGVTAWIATNSDRLLFLVFSFLIWGCLRFHQRGAAITVLIICVLTTQAAVTGTGAFGQHDLFQDMVELQAFNACVVLTALLLAAVTHQRDQARREVERTCDQLTELMRRNRQPEQFAYLAAHDLQEPLRKVVGFGRLLQRRYADQLDERARTYISLAVDGAQRMQLMVSELLAYSRVGRAESGPETVSLAEVTEEALRELAAAPGFAEAEITVGELPDVRGDPTMLRQLLGNLIGNSLKYRREAQPARIRVTASPDPAGWLIAVADDGIGVAPQFADRIFAQFGRLHGPVDYPGFGMGLALAERIVEHHGGRIWLDTERRDGTTIRFTLPALPR